MMPYLTRRFSQLHRLTTGCCKMRSVLLPVKYNTKTFLFLFRYGFRFYFCFPEIVKCFLRQIAGYSIEFSICRKRSKCINLQITQKRIIDRKIEMSKFKETFYLNEILHWNFLSKIWLKNVRRCVEMCQFFHQILALCTVITQLKRIRLVLPQHLVLLL